MARSLSEPAKPNVTKATRQAAMREVLDAKRIAETANAKLRNVYKRWEKQGVTPHSIKETIRARDMDPDALAAELREKFAAYDAAGIEIPAPDDLFPETIAPRPKENQEHIEWEAGEAGWRAGFEGVSIDDAPFPAGSILRVKWVERWHEGQAAAVERSFGEKKKPKADKPKGGEPGATDVSAATADRKRPARQPKGAAAADVAPPPAEEEPAAPARPDPDADEFA